MSRLIDGHYFEEISDALFLCQVSCLEFVICELVKLEQVPSLFRIMSNMLNYLVCARYLLIKFLYANCMPKIIYSCILSKGEKLKYLVKTQRC